MYFNGLQLTCVGGKLRCVLCGQPTIAGSLLVSVTINILYTLLYERLALQVFSPNTNIIWILQILVVLVFSFFYLLLRQNFKFFQLSHNNTFFPRTPWQQQKYSLGCIHTPG